MDATDVLAVTTEALGAENTRGLFVVRMMAEI
jgi:hypothetical protein